MFSLLNNQSELSTPMFPILVLQLGWNIVRIFAHVAKFVFSIVYILHLPWRHLHPFWCKPLFDLLNLSHQLDCSVHTKKLFILWIGNPKIIISTFYLAPFNKILFFFQIRIVQLCVKFVLFELACVPLKRTLKLVTLDKATALFPEHDTFVH